METQNQTFICPNCHRPILTSNRFTHEARCERMSRQQHQQQDQQHQTQQTRPNPVHPTNYQPFGYTNQNQSQFIQSQNGMQMQTQSFPFGRNTANTGGSLMRTVTTLPDGRVLVQERRMPAGNTQGNMGNNMTMMTMPSMGNQEMGPFPNLFAGIFGMDLGGMGGMTPEQFEETLQRQRGLDKETLDSFTVVKYDKEKSKGLDPELQRCSICLGDFEDGEDVKFLLCLHRFHKKCVDPWLEKHTTCPICKKDFSQMQFEGN